MAEHFRRTVIRFFLQKKLINERLAENLLTWRHSGFSIDNGVKIPASSQKAREALSQYISRPPLSLSKIVFEETTGIVIYYSGYNDYFKKNQQLFTVLDFICNVTQHVPPKAARYIRRYGLYSSRTRGKWLCQSLTSFVLLPPAGRRTISAPPTLPNLQRHSRRLTARSLPKKAAPPGQGSSPRYTMWTRSSAVNADLKCG